MRKLSPSEKKILSRLIFPETFDVIQEETNLQYGEIRDDLINLMSYHLVEVVDSEKPQPNGTSFYDADNIRDFTFQLTKSGMKHLNKAK